MIQELDVVILTRALETHGLPKGSRGAVVHCYRDGQGFEVEFADDTGDSATLLTLERADIELERMVTARKANDIDAHSYSL